MRRSLSAALLVVGAVGVLLALMPSARAEAGITPTLAQSAHLDAHPDDMPRTADYVLGWAGSPLVHYHTECTLTDEAGRGVTVGRSNRMEIGWLSWSSLTLVAAIGAFWVAGRLRPAPAGQLPERGPKETAGPPAIPPQVSRQG